MLRNESFIIRQYMANPISFAFRYIAIVSLPPMAIGIYVGFGSVVVEYLQFLLQDFRSSAIMGGGPKPKNKIQPSLSGRTWEVEHRVLLPI